jgi:CHAT domain-containing protein/tetratricopeptide (TPR) repeat protein
MPQGVVLRIVTLAMALVWLAVSTPAVGAASPRADQDQAPPLPTDRDAADAAGADLNRRAIAAFSTGQQEDAERLWLDALSTFEQNGNTLQQANTLRNLTFLSRLPIDHSLVLLDRALALVLPLKHAHIEGQVRAQRSDFYFIAGDLGAAAADLDIAIRLLQIQPDSRNALARALTSRGRLQRHMGRPVEAAADQQRAAEILEALGDWAGASQALHGLGLTLNEAGNAEAAVTPFARAVALARRSGNARRLAPALAQQADILERVGRPADALAALEEADTLSVTGVDRALVDHSWADVLLHQDRPIESLSHIDRVTPILDRLPADTRMLHFWLRARALDRLGRPSDALEDSTTAVELLESIRAHLVPEDDAKRGFLKVRERTLTDHVERLARAGRAGQALEAAERARGRAFLDLLASTDLRTFLPASAPIGSAPPVTATGANEANQGDAQSRIDRIVASSSAAAPRRYVPRPEPQIASVAVADPPTLATVKAQAARLGSHVLSYWVTDDRTYIWLVSPDGRVADADVPVSRTRLETLVARTWSETGEAVRGAAGQPAWRLATRGTDRLTFGREARDANRALFDLLVAPVRTALPPTGGLITVVPHRTLFKLAFAALVSPSGRYLIEDWPLHYAPSASALEFTAHRRHGRTGPALIVSDPATSAVGADNAALPRLPGAAREGQLVARALGTGRAVFLQGPAATEAQVRQVAGRASVLHFATHGIIRDDRPFESFLALTRSPGGLEQDGRLTMGEVYGLRLRADLVVLSACRSATGPISGDGIVGLSRGFFAAGAPSVIASLWDLPDGVTASLFPSFYSSWSKDRSPAAALRAAQLALIRDLRAGRVTAETPAGRFALPEHPSLWAGLMLVGEP